MRIAVQLSGPRSPFCRNGQVPGVARKLRARESHRRREHSERWRQSPPSRRNRVKRIQRHVHQQHRIYPSQLSRIRGHRPSFLPSLPKPTTSPFYPLQSTSIVCAFSMSKQTRLLRNMYSTTLACPLWHGSI